MNTDIMPPAPVTNVQQPPADQESAIQPAPEKAVPEKHETHAPLPPAPPKPGSGVNAAIAATVIMVLGLGLLATYAYLQTK